MISKRRSEITIETRDVWVVRRIDRQEQPLCTTCVEHSPMLKPEDAACLIRVTTRLIYQWVEAGLLHFTETADGGLFVCLASIGSIAT